MSSADAPQTTFPLLSMIQRTLMLFCLIQRKSARHDLAQSRAAALLLNQPKLQNDSLQQFTHNAQYASFLGCATRDFA